MSLKYGSRCRQHVRRYQCCRTYNRGIRTPSWWLLASRSCSSGGAENARPENDRPPCKAWKCKTWNEGTHTLFILFIYYYARWQPDIYKTTVIYTPWFSVLLKMQDLKLREFLREPQRNCTRCRDETTVACRQSPGYRRSKQLQQVSKLCDSAVATLHLWLGQNY